MITSRVFLLVMTVVLVQFTYGVGHAQTEFVAELNGASNVPPQNAVSATGTAHLTLNAARTELSYHIEYSGLSSAEIAAHIHNAGPRDNGAAVIALEAGSPKDGVWSNISAFHVAELFAGRLYINVHTETYFSGELRGNIEASTPVDELTLGRLKGLYSN